MTIRAIFSASGRCRGYATVDYSSSSDEETVVETTEDNLVTIFEDAKANGETLDGADESIDAATHDPLAFLDYLILDPNDEITFDPEHARENK